MATCDSTWHQFVHADGDVSWFSLGSRLRDTRGTYVYFVGAVPDRSRCTKIWAHDGVAWKCDVCGTTLEAERYQPTKPVPTRRRLAP